MDYTDMRYTNDVQICKNVSDEEFNLIDENDRHKGEYEKCREKMIKDAQLYHAYVPFQYYCGSFEPLQGLKKGTAFAELYSPYRSEDSNECDQRDMSYTDTRNRDILLKQLTALDFMAFDLRLFLDVNPQDKAAIAQYNELTNSAKIVREKYVELFGPISYYCNSDPEYFNWVTECWPWNKASNFEL